MMMSPLILTVLTISIGLQASHTAQLGAQPSKWVTADVAIALAKERLRPLSSVFSTPSEEREYFEGLLKYIARAYDSSSQKYDVSKANSYIDQQFYSPRWLTQKEAAEFIAKKFPTRSEKERADILRSLPLVNERYDRLEIFRQSMLASRQKALVNAPAAPAQVAQPVSAQEQADSDAAIAQSLHQTQAQKSKEAGSGKDTDAKRINGVILAMPDRALMRQLDAVINIFDKYQTAIKASFPRSRTRLNIDANTQTGKVAGYHLTLVNVDFPLGALTPSQSQELERKFNALVRQIQSDQNLEFTFENFEILEGEPAGTGERSPSYLVALFKPNAALQKIMNAFIEQLKKEYKNADIRIRKDIRYHISLVRMSPVIDVKKQIITIDQLKSYLSGKRVHPSWMERMETIDVKVRAQDAKILQQKIPSLYLGREAEFVMEVGPRAKEPLARAKSQAI
jgi:hypothetical protein